MKQIVHKLTAREKQEQLIITKDEKFVILNIEVSSISILHGERRLFKIKKGTNGKFIKKII